MFLVLIERRLLLMKFTIVFAAALATACFAMHGDFDWQSFGGQPGDRCSVNLIESDADHMVMEVTVPGFWLGKTAAGGSTWNSIDLPGFYNSSDIGMPEIPSVPQMFALPFGTEASVSIEDVQYTMFGGINLIPAQQPEIDMPHNEWPFRQAETVYSANSFFPENWAETTDPGTWGGISVDRLAVNPFRYNPATGELMAAASITVRVDFNGSANATAYSTTETVRNSASRMLINYDMVDASASAPSDAEAAEYVFVTTPANLDAILPLVEFYQSIGYESSVEVLTAGTEDGLIKAAIADHYDTGVTRFALLAGDHAALPSHSFSGFVGDFYYACLVGTDNNPDIAVGRLTGDSAQIATQVNKIISGYYQYSFTDTPDIIPSTSVLAAHEQNYPYKYTQCCNEIAAASYDVNMTFYKIYPPEGGTNSMVADWYNSGIGSVGYRGHGSQTAWVWSAPGAWSKSNIQALTNTFLPPTWNIDCLNGQYQDGTECLAESYAWNDHGASGNVSANNPSYTTPNHDYMKQIYLGLYNNNQFNVGETLNDAAVYIINNHSGTGLTNAQMYIWFGDPAMEIFTNDTANPVPLAISSNPGFVYSGSQTIILTVTSNGSPVSGATVALSDGIDGVASKPVSFYEEDTTNSSGQVTFTVNIPSSATSLYTGARLHNYNPVTAQITVSPSSTDDTAEEVETFTLSVASLQNPITGTAAFTYSTPVTGQSTVQVFNVSGRAVETLVNEEVTAGSHSVSWNTENMASGVYFVRLTTPAGTVSTQAMVLR